MRWNEKNEPVMAWNVFSSDCFLKYRSLLRRGHWRILIANPTKKLHPGPEVHIKKKSFPKKIVCFKESPLKMMKNAFYFILKFLFVLKILKSLSCPFAHVEKTTWLEREVLFQNLWRHNQVNNQLQNSYYPISQEVKINQTMKFGQLIEYNKR